ncbi:hypothetical protein FOZ60_016049 [Perkinsus olseni]|uniref:Uncharacterized protein n=1 Tax=Perkinsus olseni TaxID=32597 RepID=A0A7J6N4F0_PEROL|nr:hypothetical protein FOZ60_016049 [Perkinsus olseni]
MLYVIEDSDQLEACRNVLYVVARTTDLWVLEETHRGDCTFLDRFRSPLLLMASSFSAPSKGVTVMLPPRFSRSQRISKVCVRHVSGDKRKLADMGITIFPETLIDMVEHAKKRGLIIPGFVGICASSIPAYERTGCRAFRDQLVGNWNQLRLSSEQIQYAANDAWFLPS